MEFPPLMVKEFGCMKLSFLVKINWYLKGFSASLGDLASAFFSTFPFPFDNNPPLGGLPGFSSCL